MIRDFADKRGGGVLFLAGPVRAVRWRLCKDADGRNDAAASDLPKRTGAAISPTATLTDAGRESVICRLEEERDQNIARWKKMPQVANYAVMGAPKPGAVVLMNVAEAGHRPTPLLAIQNYGHGRVGVFATGGQLALENAAGSHGSHAFDVLAAVAALDGDRNAWARFCRLRRIRCCRTILMFLCG